MLPTQLPPILKKVAETLKARLRQRALIPMPKVCEREDKKHIKFIGGRSSYRARESDLSGSSSYKGRPH